MWCVCVGDRSIDTVCERSPFVMGGMAIDWNLFRLCADTNEFIELTWLLLVMCLACHRLMNYASSSFGFRSKCESIIRFSFPKAPDFLLYFIFLSTKWIYSAVIMVIENMKIYISSLLPRSNLSDGLKDSLICNLISSPKSVKWTLHRYTLYTRGKSWRESFWRNRQRLNTFVDPSALIRR